MSLTDRCHTHTGTCTGALKPAEGAVALITPSGDLPNADDEPDMGAVDSYPNVFCFFFS